VVARLAHDGRIVAFDIGGEFHSADPTLDGLHVDLLKMKELPEAIPMLPIFCFAGHP
jgi:hypothetical protein